MTSSELINGTPFYLNEPKMAMGFLIEKLGFVVHAHSVSKNLSGVMVGDNHGNFYEIFSNTRKSADNQNDFNLVIKTTDCLRDFYNMTADGLSILNKPHYVPEGLVFEALDPWGNRYTFLEKRDYTD
ncbi:MAG TPA: hypothetical protein VFE53_25990 [Mucilaginibacter sp.]|jgi:hypothetical protein|nr:hypothetical protein [Mucilaginibacter sp.]